MNVLLVTTHLNIGGITRYILLIAKALRAKGVGVLVVSGGGDFEGEFKKLGIETVRIDLRTKSELSPKVLTGGIRLSSLAKERKVDIIHAHTRVTQCASALAGSLSKVPFVTTCHGFFRKRLGRMLFGAWGERVVAISEPVRQSLINDFRVAPDRIELIHTGIEPERFCRACGGEELARLKKRLGLGAGLVVGSIGRLSPVKGHRFFVDALGGIVRKGHALRGLIIGDGPDEESLKALAAERGLQGSLCFLGSQTDTAAYLAIMDIFVFPSEKEGLGLSLLEAMASGRACVASDVGGISDIVQDGKTGLLFPAGDAGAMGERILRLAADATLRERLGEEGRRLVQERFSLDVMAEKMLAMYRSVIAGAGRGIA